MTVMIDSRCLKWLFEFKTNEADGNRQESGEIFRGVRFFPSPLVGEGGSTARSDGETDEGSLSADEISRIGIRG
jgi:hypothetical protein